MKLPSYYIIGIRPIKAVATKDGGMTILAFDWKTGEFVQDLTYLTAIFMPTDEDIEAVSEKRFNETVEELRKRLKNK